MPWFLIQVVVFILQVQAFAAGVHHAWGFGLFGAFVVWLLTLFVPGLGSLFVAAVTFYGAYAAWDWAWWQAFIVAAPSLALSLLVMAGGSVLAGLGAMFGRRA